jgi:hypothetical protein
MKKAAFIINSILIVALSLCPVQAQKKQTKQTDADVPLHLMQPQYTIPYHLY